MIGTGLSILMGHLAKLLTQWKPWATKKCLLPCEVIQIDEIVKGHLLESFWFAYFCCGCIFQMRSHYVVILALDSQYCCPHLPRARAIGTYLHTSAFLSIDTIRHQATSSTEE